MAAPVYSTGTRNDFICATEQQLRLYMRVKPLEMIVRILLAQGSIAWAEASIEVIVATSEGAYPVSQAPVCILYVHLSTS